MPASLGIKLEPNGWQGIETALVINAVGDGSSLFYPQTWWTAAHEGLGILYIITNNHEYHTLQVGLGQVVEAYGSAPGYGWQPKTLDPGYLRIERPELDFVALAKAIGGQEGEIVQHPKDVHAAVRRGVDYVLREKKSYILDMRTAQAPGTTPALDATDIDTSERYAAQPPLDIFHETHEAQSKSLHATKAHRVKARVRVIF
jgi:benzoylformate decarboxylase